MFVIIPEMFSQNVTKVHHICICSRPPSVNDNESGWISWEKRHITLFLSHCHIQEKDIKTGKVAKGKRTNAQYKQYQLHEI